MKRIPMLKKVISLISVLLIAFTLVGCGSGGKALKMTDFTQAYINAGVTVDVNEKPLFPLIGAKDGITFYMDSNPVKIYEYESKAKLDKAEKDFPIMSDWTVNGLFVLESSQDKASEIFKNVK
jgi:hypothetical protein